MGKSVPQTRKQRRVPAAALVLILCRRGCGASPANGAARHDDVVVVEFQKGIAAAGVEARTAVLPGIAIILRIPCQTTRIRLQDRLETDGTDVDLKNSSDHLVAQNQ